jgi:hypothetical protein
LSKFEDQYYLLYPLLTPGSVFLQADDATAARADLTAPIPPGKPLRFFNDLAEEGVTSAICVPQPLARANRAVRYYRAAILSDGIHRPDRCASP